jgi:hypothetical protein
MIEDYHPEIVASYLNGVASESYLMVKLMGQVLVILIVGIFLWRISVAFSKKKVNRRQNVFSESRFQKHWRK